MLSKVSIEREVKAPLSGFDLRPIASMCLAQLPQCSHSWDALLCSLTGWVKPIGLGQEKLKGHF